MTLEARFSQLEKRYLRLRAAMLLTAVAGTLVITIGGAIPNADDHGELRADTVIANRIVVIDKDKKERIYLETSADPAGGAQLRIMGPGEQPGRVLLTAQKSRFNILAHTGTPGSGEYLLDVTRKGVTQAIKLLGGDSHHCLFRAGQDRAESSVRSPSGAAIESVIVRDVPSFSIRDDKGARVDGFRGAPIEK